MYVVEITQSHLLLPLKFLCILAEIARCTHLGGSRHDKSDRSSEIKVTVHPTHGLICGAWQVMDMVCNLKLQAIVK